MGPWKGKARDDGYGDGGSGGIVLPLDMFTVATYETVYSLPLSVGTPAQTLSVQVDTGSSDLWIASTSCSTQACKQANGHLYDPSQAQKTGKSFSINYVQGEVSGPIVWDTIRFGGYEIDGQALAAATSVDSEPLTSLFSGVLGLSLPLDSIIASNITPSTSNAFDGAVVPSNLFTISPSYTAPSYRFLSLTLERPDGGESSVPSLLGIGRHPPESVVADASKVQYSSVTTANGATTGSGPQYWQSYISAITVYVDGVRKEIDVSSTATSLVDSGTPVILASEVIANGIYGALGIGPGSDGQYWVPCTTPINMSVTLDSRTEIALHPLDLTFSGQSFSGSLSSSTSSVASNSTFSSASSNSMCMGMIQSYPPTSNLAQIADVVLGVPFMRSVYTVLAYDPPDSKGNFPNASSGMVQAIRPRLGLLGLIDPTTALNEFHQERVLNQPLPAPSGSNNNNGGAGSTGSRSNVSVASGKKMSVGVEVLIGLLGFAALVAACFGTWWVVLRRRRARERREDFARGLYAGTGSGDPEDEKDRAEAMQRDAAAFMLARRSSRTSSRYGPAEDTLRAKKFQEYLDRQSRRESELVGAYSDETLQTRVGDPAKEKDIGLETDEVRRYSEMGYLTGSGLRQSTTYADDDNEGDLHGVTLVGRGERGSMLRDYPPSPTPTHTRMSTMTSDRELDADAAVAVPLLAHTRTDSQGSVRSGYPSERAALGIGRPASHARVGSFGADGVPGARPLSTASTSSVQGSLPRPQQRSLSGPRPMSQRHSSAGSMRSSVSSVSSRRTSPRVPPPPPLPILWAAVPPENDSVNHS